MRNFRLDVEYIKIETRMIKKISKKEKKKNGLFLYHRNPIRLSNRRKTTRQQRSNIILLLSSIYVSRHTKISNCFDISLSKSSTNRPTRPLSGFLPLLLLFLFQRASGYFYLFIPSSSNIIYPRFAKLSK